MFILELETGFPGGFGESFHFAMINVTTTVKDNVADVRCFGALCDEGSDAASAFDVCLWIADSFVESRGGNEGAACYVVHDLDIHMLIGEMHGEAWAAWCAGDLATDALVNALPDFFAIDRTHEILVFFGSLG
jgi:hypothetical protein